MYFDAHCHIPVSHFPNYADVLHRAHAAGVSRVIVNGISHHDNELLHSWNHPVLRKAYGLHPCEHLGDVSVVLDWIKKHVSDCVAIGEIGLDGHWKPETLSEQKSVFLRMLSLSDELELPVIIHSRKAEKDVLDIVSAHTQSVVLHAFGGSVSLIEQGIKQKCYFSLNSNISRSSQVQTLAKLVPLRQLLTETHSPYMGKDKDVFSEPKDVVHTVEVLASIKGITVEECKNVLFMNYQTVFGR